MIQKIKVAIPQRPYFISIGKGSLQTLAPLIQETRPGKDAVVITTKNILELYGKQLRKQLDKACDSVLVLTVPDTEKSKNAKLALRLIEKITRFDTKKKVFLVAFGGGVVGDLTGFIAAIYKRGVAYIQIPTTLLAQIDSSIGGKTALDTSFGKNLVGAFHQPRFVLSDIAFLKTLPDDQIRAGLSEAVKYALIKDSALFDFIKRNLAPIMAREPRALSPLVRMCAAIKAKIVAMDEFDKKGTRIILNFGHTFGHAIEAACGYKVSHGEGVAIGMVCAARLSVELGLLEEKTERALKELIAKIGHTTRLQKTKLKAIVRALSHDKKFSQGSNRFVLLEKIGKTKIVSNVPEKLIRKVLVGQTNEEEVISSVGLSCGRRN
jgi:3-dehydroquinate synthase